MGADLAALHGWLDWVADLGRAQTIRIPVAAMSADGLGADLRLPVPTRARSLPSFTGQHAH
jgi:hypothetical protein